MGRLCNDRRPLYMARCEVIHTGREIREDGSRNSGGTEAGAITTAARSLAPCWPLAGPVRGEQSPSQCHMGAVPIAPPGASSRPAALTGGRRSARTVPRHDGRPTANVTVPGSTVERPPFRQGLPFGRGHCHPGTLAPCPAPSRSARYRILPYPLAPCPTLPPPTLASCPSSCTVPGLASARLTAPPHREVSPFRCRTRSPRYGPAGGGDGDTLGRGGARARKKRPSRFTDAPSMVLLRPACGE